MQVVTFTRKSDCWMGTKESFRTVRERDFRSSCHLYGSDNYRHEDSQGKRKKGQLWGRPVHWRIARKARKGTKTNKNPKNLH